MREWLHPELETSHARGHPPDRTSPGIAITHAGALDAERRAADIASADRLAPAQVAILSTPAPRVLTSTHDLHEPTGGFVSSLRLEARELTRAQTLGSPAWERRTGDLAGLADRAGKGRVPRLLDRDEGKDGPGAEL
jgi:hypothetical protein